MKLTVDGEMQLGFGVVSVTVGGLKKWCFQILPTGMVDTPERSFCLPALGATCKLCHWRSHCTDGVEKLDDLTLIAELGRAKGDLIMPHIRTVTDLANIHLSYLRQGSKTAIKGMDLSTLRKF